MIYMTRTLPSAAVRDESTTDFEMDGVSERP